MGLPGKDPPHRHTGAPGGLFIFLMHKEDSASHGQDEVHSPEHIGQQAMAYIAGGSHRLLGQPWFLVLNGQTPLQ